MLFAHHVVPPVPEIIHEEELVRTTADHKLRHRQVLPVHCQRVRERIEWWLRLRHLVWLALTSHRAHVHNMYMYIMYGYLNYVTNQLGIWDASLHVRACLL